MIDVIISAAQEKINPVLYPKNSNAINLSPTERKKLSVQALAKTSTITDLANRNNVSRKFVYGQKKIANEALEEAFSADTRNDHVLFYLPVTKKWIHQFVLALILICHSSFRGVIEILDSLFDYRKISLGTIHNIVMDATKRAAQINKSEDLSKIRYCAPDEIFQNRKPVLVGVDVESTYCYLLSAEEHRDETTWGVHLLELKERGLNPDYTIADGGKGLRAGQAAAWPNIPCHGDVFHAEREMGKLASYMENRAASATTKLEEIELKMLRAKSKGKGQRFSKALALARQKEQKALFLAENIRTLSDWMRDDVLSLAGPSRETRYELFDFILDELEKLKPLCSYKIHPVLRMLKNQRKTLLAFADILEKKFAVLANQHDIPLYLIHFMCELQGEDLNQSIYWKQKAELQKKLKGQFFVIYQAVQEILADTPRASSLVENLNSRLRNYFFLRRHIGNDYLELLRYFLNHRRFIRSERPERAGLSPIELMTQTKQPHWLESLGFEQFQRA